MNMEILEKLWAMDVLVSIAKDGDEYQVFGSLVVGRGDIVEAETSDKNIDKALARLLTYMEKDLADYNPSEAMRKAWDEKYAKKVPT